MAAYVYREDIKIVFKKAIEIFEKRSGLSHSQKRTAFYQFMTDDINAVLKRTRISSRFLQKKMASEVIQNYGTQIIAIDIEHLNALYAYVINDPYGEYEKEYIIGRSPADIKALEIKKKNQNEINNDESRTKSRNFPDFPVNNASYPTSPLIPLYYNEFQRLWIKDESYNITGTVKDRWAWAVVKYYKRILEEHDTLSKDKPRLCLVSSGPKAIALQYLLKKLGLPALKVMVVNKIKTNLINIEKALESMGATTIGHSYDEYKKLSIADIQKALHTNEADIDLTFVGEDSELSELYHQAYEWLALEILEQNPDYCFIPFGRGLLFQTLLAVAKREILSGENTRLQWADLARIRNCTFYGIKVEAIDENTLFDKLFVKNVPVFSDLEDYTGLYCNPKTTILNIKENPDIENNTKKDYVKAAIKMADEFGINGEPNSLVGLASFLEMEDVLPKEAKIIILNTGNLILSDFENSEKRKKRNERTGGR